MRDLIHGHQSPISHLTRVTPHRVRPVTTSHRAPNAISRNEARTLQLFIVMRKLQGHTGVRRLAANGFKGSRQMNRNTATRPHGFQQNTVQIAPMNRPVRRAMRLLAVLTKRQPAHSLTTRIQSFNAIGHRQKRFQGRLKPPCFEDSGGVGAKLYASSHLGQLSRLIHHCERVFVKFRLLGPSVRQGQPTYARTHHQQLRWGFRLRHELGCSHPTDPATAAGVPWAQKKPPGYCEPRRRGGQA